MASNSLKGIGDTLAGVIDWIKGALQDEAIRKSIAEDLGLPPGQPVPTANLPQNDSVAQYRSQANPDKEAFIILLNDLRALYQAVGNFRASLGLGGLAAASQATNDLFDLLALNYFRLYGPPWAYFGVQLVAEIVKTSSDLVRVAGSMGEDPPADVADELEIVRLGTALLDLLKFIGAPIYYVVEFFKYVLDSGDRTLTLLAAALYGVREKFGVPLDVIYGWDTLPVPAPNSGSENDAKSTTPIADGISKRMLTVAFPFDQNPTPGATLAESLRATIAIKSKGPGATSAGFFLGVGGEGAVEFPLSKRWKFVLEASAIPAFSLLYEVIYGFTSHGPLRAPLNVALVSVPDAASDVAYAFPNSDETRLEIGQLALTGSFDGSFGSIEAQARRCALVLATKDHDGFLAKILPSDGLRIPFELGVGYSRKEGFFKHGGIDWPSGGGLPAIPKSKAPTTTLAKAAPAPSPPPIPNLGSTSQPELGLSLTIPIGKTLAGVTLDHMLLNFAPGQSSAVKLEVSAGLSAKVGPFAAVVDRIGFETALSFPGDDSGNMGFANLGLGFKWPNGVGIAIDSSFVSGGGYLFFDPDKGQYGGVLSLSIGMITITAIGLIATRFPDGRKGFSFVVIITAEGFGPYPLGLGFTLTGIGGLLAVNRTCNTDFLSEGIKSRTLEDLLFPKDPVRNAPQIFGTLNNAFPIKEGSVLFGPVFRICWFTPPLVTMDLGVIIELGPRTRLIVLGRIAAIMPSEKHDLVRLQMNVLGVIDFDQRKLSLDAAIYDSRLAGKFPVTGSMAMRLSWGSEPEFALSMGGFHPAFNPPANFPALERLAISFSNTDDFRLRCEAYIAITSNTLQFGARVELYARVGDFSVEGGIGYDVLITFDPFTFVAEFFASVQLKYGSRSLFKVSVAGQLAGPKPLQWDPLESTCRHASLSIL